MNRIVIATIATLGAAGAAQAELSPLLTPAELQAALADQSPILLDIRGEAYGKGHIAGAVSAPYGLFRGPKDNPGEQLPVAQLEQTYESLGLVKDRPLVIVPEGDSNSDFGAAARVYWTLKSSGFPELSILNGGMTAWQGAGLGTETAAVTPAPSDLSITWDDRWTADTEEVAGIVEGQSRAVLVDARPAEFYEGRKAHDAAKRPGTLPGAQNLVHSSWFEGEATAISARPDVAALKKTLGIGEGEEVVSFCNTGHWAATNWFALSELEGIENVKLYPGSMVEYSKTDHEMANVPGLLGNLLNQLRGN